MVKEQYLVQKNQAGKVKYHLFSLSGSRVTREWGLIGGVIQGVYHDYEATNKGKANEASPETVAEEDFDRIVAIKIKEGYIPTDTLEDLPDLPEPIDSIDLNNIPTCFCLSKPTKTITAKAIDKLLKTGFGQFFVKYNGGHHYILVDGKGDIHVFTRRWDDHTAKYPSVVKAAKEAGYRPLTLIAVELCIDPSLGLSHMWAFKLFASISKADTLKGKLLPDQSESLARQAVHPVRAAVFAVLYYGGLKTWDQPYAEQLDYINILAKPLGDKQVFFRPQKAHIKSGAEAIALAKAYKVKIEGFVLWDLRESMEVTMTGKPLRRAAWKVKAKAEMEVIAVAGIYGKKPGLFGSIQIMRYDKDGNEIDMGTVGGLKHKEGEADPSYWNFPCVIEVIYDNIFPDTGLLQFGSFLKKHEDKLLSEVNLFSLG